MIATQVQQMKMFNAQFEKEMRGEGRKNRKLVEKVFHAHTSLRRGYLSPLKSSIKEIKQNDFLCSHFLEILLFQTNYLEIAGCAV